MINLPIIHFDCKHFEGDRPCAPNKLYSVFCEGCLYYEKDSGRTGEFPDIENHKTKEFNKDNIEIIIVKLDAVGDVLRTTSILPSLKKKYSNSNITWITKRKSFPVLNGNKLINNIFFVEDNLQSIYDREFDISINLDSGKDSCAIMNNINAGERFGYYLVNNIPYPINNLANEWYLMGVNDNFKKGNKKTYHQIIHEICGFEYNNTSPSLNLNDERKNRADEIKNKEGISGFREFVLINLGGGNRWQYKKWTKEGYAELINKLSENKEKAVGVVAGYEDKNFYEEVLSCLNTKDNIIKLGFNNSTDDFISIISLADKIFTSDSLGFHIANALCKYAVVIVGPTSYTELDVFGNGEIIYSNKVDCLVCYLNKCDKAVTCMNTISADRILPLLN
ncbi:MAG: lipopolysaccharide heptosyltransferase family protein [Ignavibacteriae bacterium]|nr:MAG: lipopolysaccharide heptosyltransferase family protein [Ignavibacteriota bacterium]